MILTKYDASTSDEKVQKLTREFIINYRACIESLICLLSRRVDLSFEVNKLAKISSNLGKVYFEVLVHLLRYIRNNKNLGLNYHASMKGAPLSDLQIQAYIKTKNHLMALYYYSWQDFAYTDRSTGA